MWKPKAPPILFFFVAWLATKNTKNPKEDLKGEILRGQASALCALIRSMCLKEEELGALCALGRRISPPPRCALSLGFFALAFGSLLDKCLSGSTFEG